MPATPRGAENFANGSATAADWQRVLNNVEFSVFSSAARTASTDSGDQINYNAAGARLWLKISAVTGTSPTLDIKIQNKDPVGGGYFDLPGATLPQKNSTGSDELLIYPGVTEVTQESIASVLSRTWRVVATIGGSDTPTFTFSIGGCYAI